MKNRHSFSEKSLFIGVALAGLIAGALLISSFIGIGGNSLRIMFKNRRRGEQLLPSHVDPARSNPSLRHVTSGPTTVTGGGHGFLRRAQDLSSLQLPGVWARTLRISGLTMSSTGRSSLRPTISSRRTGKNRSALPRMRSYVATRSVGWHWISFPTRCTRPSVDLIMIDAPRGLLCPVPRSDGCDFLCGCDGEEQEEIRCDACVSARC
uniref:Uncharacterized protein n=1 Tax=Fagus sylvatica TaxID=28930 RepID=A0A2N9HES5_FAGSY